jgi:CBS domain-containing protein
MPMLETLRNLLDRERLQALFSRWVQRARGERQLRCEEIMKRDVECVTLQDSLQLAARKMRDQNVGFLPVCANGKTVAGTITDRDLAVRAVADDRSAAQTRIGDVMTREVVACHPRDPLKRAEQLMSQYHKSRILCIDEAGKLVGVISLSDLAQHQAGEAALTLRNVTTREARA